MSHQGKADRSVSEGHKREPINHPISVGAVSRLGNMVGEGTPFKTLQKDGGGLEAPMKSVKTSNSGSQGRY